MIRERRKPGPDVGSKVRKLYEHVCEADDCPRKGEPFMGTKKARFCSPACGLRDWRGRQKEVEVEP